MINKNLVGSKCSRCSSPEIWNYVVRCNKLKELRYKFIEYVIVNLIKHKLNDGDVSDTFDIIEDILMYLEEDNIEEIEEFETSQ